MRHMRLSAAFRAALLGPAYFAHQRLIAASKTWSACQTEEYQARRTSRLLERYGDTIRSKDQYRADLVRYTTLPLPGLTRRVSTGGTSASPMSFYMDTFARRQKERAYIFDIWSEVGYTPFDLRVVYRGNIGKNLISYNWLENSYSISPAQLTSAKIKDVIAFLRALPPFYLHVYPSSLISLVELLGDETMRTLPILGILAGSEAFPSAQMLTLERKLGFSIAHWYGHSEYATLARYCRHCGGFHFYPTYGRTELVEAEAGLHRIVATSFNSIGTHFVRYDTGDLARLSERTCSQPFLRIDAVVGRVQEYFVGRDGARYAFGPFLFGIHNRFWELTIATQFVQKMPGLMIVRMAFKPGASREDQDWAREFLRSRFSPVELVFSSADSIEKTANGKLRYYINELATKIETSAR